MRHLSCIIAALLLAANAITAQDTLWVKSNDRYTKPSFIVLQGTDSTVFRNASIRTYTEGSINNFNYSALIPAMKQSADSISSAAFTFEWPGRIIWKPTTSDNNYNNDYYNPNSQWSFKNSKESEHFIVFWDKAFGDDPNANSVPSNLRVNIDDLLRKAETFYATNVDILEMCSVGQGKSQLDTYKMIIHLLYDDGWTAVGSGYDDMIGALWVTPSTCHPVGSTIAHEIGHSFQYMVATDYRLNSVSNYLQRGWRYGYGANGSGGNAFWEQCAQWQSFQDYPSEAFGYNVAVWLPNCHRHFCHEWMRYASYWLQYHWTEKQGKAAYGRIWRESHYPEDPLETYCRLFCNDDWQVFWDDYFEYATKLQNYQFEAIHQYLSTNYSARSYKTQMYQCDDNFYQVAYASCPETSGVNIIPLTGWKAGEQITVEFEGLNPGSTLHSSDPGHAFLNDGGSEYKVVSTYNNAGNAENRGWRYALVAISNDKTIVSEIGKASEGNIIFTVPSPVTRVSLVVVGTPSKYNRHAWDEKDENDAQWPYKVRFTRAKPSGI
ncbi:MAG: hypothetical protein J5486_02915 [Bacteroidaceae bacterium]|nr:hypothetical protein [Bacteroidaceae bacterium]